MTSFADPDAVRVVADALAAALSACAATSARDLADVRVAIAYSGGLDSSVLLDAAVRVVGVQRCVALHVHHGLSPHADGWLAHCEAVARAYGVAFAARRVSVPPRPAEGIEAAARAARYRALDALCIAQRAHSLWLAQHADDQAETVLLQLLRGTGLAGLAAMAPMAPMRAGARQNQHRDQNQGGGQSQEQGRNQSQNQAQNHDPGEGVPRVRPLLALSRAQLERYARARALHWIDDESNADLRYARNALRHTVMPALGAHFPGFRRALARTAAHAATAQQLLDDLARIDLHHAGADADRALRLDALLALDDARALNLLRYWMRTLDLPAASNARITDALRQLRDVGGVHGDAHDADNARGMGNVGGKRDARNANALREGDTGAANAGAANSRRDADETHDADKAHGISSANARHDARAADKAHDTDESGNTADASGKRNAHNADETHDADKAHGISSANARHDARNANKLHDTDEPGNTADASGKRDAHNADETHDADKAHGTSGANARHDTRNANKPHDTDESGNTADAGGKRDAHNAGETHDADKAYGISNDAHDVDKPHDTDNTDDANSRCNAYGADAAHNTDRLVDTSDMNGRHCAHDADKARDMDKPVSTGDTNGKDDAHDVDEARDTTRSVGTVDASGKRDAYDVDKAHDAGKARNTGDMRSKRNAYEICDTAKRTDISNAGGRYDAPDANKLRGTDKSDDTGDANARRDAHHADAARTTNKLGDTNTANNRHDAGKTRDTRDTRDTNEADDILDASGRHDAHDVNKAHDANKAVDISDASGKPDVPDVDETHKMHDTHKPASAINAGGRYDAHDADKPRNADKPAATNHANDTPDASNCHDERAAPRNPPAHLRASRATHAPVAHKIHAAGKSKSPNDHLLRIDHAGQRLRCHRGLVFWEATMTTPAKAKPHDAVQQLWRGEEVWRLPQWRGTFVFAPIGANDASDANGTNSIDAENALPEALLRRAPLVARARSGGERMQDTPGGPTRTLKNLFQARGIPAWARDVPLLFSGDTLLFVPSIGVNRAALAQIVEPAGATRWRRIEWRADLLIA